MKNVPKLPDSKFTNEKCAEGNRVFLWENHDDAPFIRPVSGWKIIGYGNAPWPGNSKGFAAMLEKVTPATPEKDRVWSKPQDDFAEGTQIWQHINKNHFMRLLVVKG